jgi:hypothetical protein
VAVRIPEDALVDLHLASAADFGIVRLEFQRIGIIIVALDRAVREKRNAIHSFPTRALFKGGSTWMAADQRPKRTREERRAQ